MIAIILTVILVMPQGKEDIQQSRRMTSVEECLKTAQAWLEQDAKVAGGIGLAAMCQSTPAPPAPQGPPV